jgi:hypothetical protein
MMRLHRRLLQFPGPMALVPPRGCSGRQRGPRCLLGSASTSLPVPLSRSPFRHCAVGRNFVLFNFAFLGAVGLKPVRSSAQHLPTASMARTGTPQRSRATIGFPLIDKETLPVTSAAATESTCWESDTANLGFLLAPRVPEIVFLAVRRCYSSWWSVILP